MMMQSFLLVFSNVCRQNPNLAVRSKLMCHLLASVHGDQTLDNIRKRRGFLSSTHDACIHSTAFLEKKKKKKPAPSTQVCDLVTMGALTDIHHGQLINSSRQFGFKKHVSKIYARKTQVRYWAQPQELFFYHSCVRIFITKRFVSKMNPPVFGVCYRTWRCTCHR